MNTDVYTGADGSILLSAPQDTEGSAAQAIIESHDLVTVGRVQDVQIEVQSAVRAYHEIGQRYATQLRPGNVTVRGTIGRAYINGALLGLLLGEAAQGRPGASWVQPHFNITVGVDNPANTSRNILTLHDVKLANWKYHMPEDEFVIERSEFYALYITSEDA